jgi:hypothetical protein
LPIRNGNVLTLQGSPWWFSHVFSVDLIILIVAHRCTLQGPVGMIAYTSMYVRYWRSNLSPRKVKVRDHGTNGIISLNGHQLKVKGIGIDAMSTMLYG